MTAEGADCYPARYTTRNPGPEKDGGHSPTRQRSDEIKVSREKSGAKGDAARESHQFRGEGVASTKAGGHPDGT